MSDQQTTREHQDLLQCLILSQLQVFTIDKIQNNSKFWQQDVKLCSKHLVDAIIKKHGKHITPLYEVGDGDWVGQFINIIDKTTENMANMGVVQFGAMKEFTEMLIENPTLTFSEEEKDKIVREGMAKTNKLQQSAAKATHKASALIDYVNNAQIPSNIREEITKELSLIKTALRP